MHSQYGRQGLRSDLVQLREIEIEFLLCVL